jgi:hypothetical protein
LAPFKGVAPLEELDSSGLGKMKIKMKFTVLQCQFYFFDFCWRED